MKVNGIKVMTTSGEHFIVCAHWSEQFGHMLIDNVERETNNVQYASPYIMMYEIQEALNLIVAPVEVNDEVGARMVVREPLGTMPLELGAKKTVMHADVSTTPPNYLWS